MRVKFAREILSLSTDENEERFNVFTGAEVV